MERQLTTLADAYGIATRGIVADAASLIGDRDVLYAGAAAATGLADPREYRDANSEDFIPACLARCAIDRKLGGVAFEAPAVRAEYSKQGALPVRAVPALWLYARDDTADAPAEHFEALFRSAMHEQGIGEYSTPVHGREHHAEVVSSAVSLLQDLIPEITDSVLPFVHQLVLLDAPVSSLYLTQVPESIFVSSSLLKGDLIALGDALLHESLHEKMSVLRLTRQVMRPGYSDSSSGLVLLPWSLEYEKPRWFNAGRVLSAAHVYAHLAVLYATATYSPSTSSWPARDDESGEARAVTALERGGFLLFSATSGDMELEFGRDGVLLREQLSSMLEIVRASLPASVLQKVRTWHEVTVRKQP